MAQRHSKFDFIPSAYIGTCEIEKEITIKGVANFANVSSTLIPTEPDHVTNKTYVDNCVIAGTGLTKTGSSLSVKSSQPQITSVGTLSNLTTSGNFMPGGVTIIPFNNGTESLRLTRLDGGTTQCILGVDPNPTQTQFNIKNLSGSGIIRVETVTNGNVNFEGGFVNVKNTTDSTTPSNGALRVLGGVGISQSLNIGSNLGLGAVGTFSMGFPSVPNGRFLIDNNGDMTLARGICMILNGTDSTSITTGCLKLGGGMAVTKSISISGQITFSPTDNWILGKPFDPFTSGKHLNLGRWGLVMETNSLNIGIPAGLSNRQFAISGYNLDSTRTDYFKVSGVGSVSVLKTMTVDENLFVTGIATLATVNTTGNLSVGGTFSVSNFNITSITQGGIYTQSVQTNNLTGSQAHARSVVLQSTNSVNDTFDMFELRNKAGNTVLRSSLSNGSTAIGAGLYSVTGQFDMGSSAAGSTIQSGVVSTLSAEGTGNSAQMNFIVNGGQTNTSMWKFYRSGNPANPLATISGDGSFKCSNYDAQTVSGITQTGVTFTKTTDLNWYAKRNRLVDCYVTFVTSAASGTATTGLIIPLPSPANYTANIDNATVIRNGTVTVCRLAFTAGSSNATLTTSNGMGGFNNPSVQTGGDNWNIIFSYGSQT